MTRIVETEDAVFYLGKRRAYRLCLNKGDIQASSWVAQYRSVAIRPHERGLLIWDGSDDLGEPIESGQFWNGVDAACTSSASSHQRAVRVIGGKTIEASPNGLRWGGRWYATATPIQRVGPEIPDFLLIRCKRRHTLDGDWYAVRPQSA